MLEEIGIRPKFLLSGNSSFLILNIPHGSDDRDVCHSIVATKLAKEIEITDGNSSHPGIGDAVEIDHASKQLSSYVPSRANEISKKLKEYVTLTAC